MDDNSASSQGQRQIELQSSQDLAYLIANVRNAATERLNEAFPQLESDQGEDDDLRNQIEAIVHQYINKTFTIAAPNLSINGLPVDANTFLSDTPARQTSQVGNDQQKPQQPYEPFDSRKRRRLADLITQEEKLLEEVAALKRSVPAAAAKEYTERLSAGIQRDEELLRQRSAVAAAAAASSVSALNVPPLERQDDVEAQFRMAVEALGRLKRDMPSVVAKLERARVAGDYVINDG